MRIGILSESDTDDEIVRLLIERILKREVHVLPRRSRHRGWPSPANLLPAVLRHLHYQTDAEALVVVVDADQSLPHDAAHTEFVADCRYCMIQERITSTTQSLSPMARRVPILTAVAVAPPSLEAWLLYGLDPGCTEAGWIQRRNEKVLAYDEIRRLKRSLFGADRVDPKQAIVRARDAVARVCTDLESLERAFPNSFGILAQAVRQWPT